MSFDSNRPRESNPVQVVPSSRGLIDRALDVIGGHVPNVWALLIAIARFGTVLAGAMLVRGLDQWILVVSALAIAGIAMEMETKFVFRLAGPVDPKQSLAGILVSWLPAFAIVVSLNSLAAFSVGMNALQHEHLASDRLDYWQSEKFATDRWLTDFRLAAAKAGTAAEADVTAELSRIAAARAAKQPYSTADLIGFRRRASAVQALARQAAAVVPLSVQPPDDPGQQDAEISRVFRTVGDTYVAATSLVDSPAPPTPDVFAARAGDAMSLFLAETRARTPRAIGAWISALLFELLGFASIHLGGRRTPIAERVRNLYRRAGETVRAFAGMPPRGAGEPVAVSVQPMGYEGAVIVRGGLAGRTARELWPHISNALARVPEIGAHTLNRLCRPDGGQVDLDAPLLPQLDGRPLVIVLESAGRPA